MRPLLIVSELYYPEETSTGYFVTGIAEGIQSRGDWDVRVLSVQPTYSKRGALAPQSEVLKGVDVCRLSAPVGDKNKLIGRVWNMLSLTLRMGFRLFREIKRGDHVLVVTNPPSLPILVAWITWLKGATPVLLVHDVYPDVFVPTGLADARSFFFRGVDLIQKHMLRHMSRVIVLGRDMKLRIEQKLQGDATQVVTIPNWGDVDSITPNRTEQNPIRGQYELEDKFIVQFSGNLGRTHGLEDVVEIAKRLREETQIHFFIFGWGAGRQWLENEIDQHQLSNILLLPPCKKEELSDYLNACDLFFMPFKEGMEGISVPSRMYNVMAAGNAFLAVASKQSELGLVVDEERIGYVVQPGNIDRMEQCIRESMTQFEELKQMRERSRAAAMNKYTREHVVDAYNALFNELAQLKA